MPSLIGSLFVSLTADFNGFQRNMQSAEGVVAQTSAGMRKHMGLTERSVGSLQRTMSSGMRPSALIAAGRSFDSAASRANLLRGSVFALTAAFGGLGAALTTNVVARYFDTFTGIENQIRVVAKDSGDLAAQIQAVGDVATRSRSSLSAVATLYSRLSKASPGQDPEKILRRVETVNKALQLGGATAQEAASAAIQFSQAVQSNRLGGEELRAVLETPLGGALAKGLGITIAKLREMSLEGKLTAEVLNRALDNISGTIDGQFAKSVATIDQSLTNADTAITLYAGRLDDAYGITKLITGGIDGFANNLETLIPLLTTVGALMGTVFAARRSGSVGQTLLAPVTGIMAIRAARQDNLKFAKEEVEAAKAALAVENDRVAAARKVASGNMRDLGGKAELKAYQKAQADLGKVEKERLAITQQQAEVQRRLADISVGQAAGAISRDKEAIGLRKQMVALDKQAISNQMQFAAARGGVTTTRKALTASGAAFAGKGMEEAARGAQQAASAFSLADQRMAAAARTAGIVRMGIGALNAGVSSLVGFLGGPWGFAFTVATAALAFFGLRARKAAEEVAEAQAIIREELEKGGMAGNITPAEQKSLLERQLIEQAERLAKAQKEAHRVRDETAANLRGNVIALPEFQAGIYSSGKPLEAMKEFNDLLERFRDGKATVDEVTNAITNLGVSAEKFSIVFKDAWKAQNEIDLAKFAIDRIKKTIEELTSKNYAINIDVKYMYPTGSGPDPADALKLQYKALEDMRRSATVLTNRTIDRRNFKQDILDAAGDTGDKALNSEVKIRRRADALFEQGKEMGFTREEAAALAREELNLAEVSRLAAKADKDQTKDLEKLTDKMKELREEADAAFMSEADRAVVNITKKFDNVSPGQEQQIRDSILQKQAAESWREIIQTYGTGEQLTATFSDKQRELNYLVATGRITAAQAGLAWADFIGTFKEHQWIDQTADALGGFLDSALTDFDNLEDAFKDLLKNMAKIIIQESVTKPFTDWFRSSVSSMFGGGATGSSGGTGIGSQIVEAIGSKIFGGGAAKQVAASVSKMVTGSTKTGIPLAEVGAQGFKASVNADYADRFQGMLGWLDSKGYKLNSVGGYNYRNIAGSNKLSNHASGNAIDINPAANPDTGRGGRLITDLPPGTSEAAKGFGLKWGGDWQSKKDAMHFEVDKNVTSLQGMATQTKTATDAVTKMAGASGAATQGLGTLGGGAQQLGNALGQFPAAPAAPGGGGLFGSLFGGIGKLFGFGSPGANLSSTAWAAINSGTGGLYSSGGYTGPGGKHDPAGVVHRGEYVFDAESTRRIGVDKLDKMRQYMGRFAGGPMAGFGGGQSWSSDNDNGDPYSGRLSELTGIFGRRGKGQDFAKSDSLATARRFHNGKTRSNEFRAILEKGEDVLTKNQSRRNSSAMSGLTGLAARGGGQTMGLHVSVEGARGNQEIMDMVEAGVSQGIQKFRTKEAPAIAIRSVQEYQKRK